MLGSETSPCWAGGLGLYGALMSGGWSLLHFSFGSVVNALVLSCEYMLLLLS